MTTDEFVKELEQLSLIHKNIKLYPYENKAKLYDDRFLSRVYFDEPSKMVAPGGWLADLYAYSNGVDLSNFYIVPFNNYFNKKELSFEHFYDDWSSDRHSANEINGLSFLAFMADDNLWVGIVKELIDSDGNNFIAIAKKGKLIKDLLIITSSVYKLYDNIISQLKDTGKIDLPYDEDYWRSLDMELDEFYKQGKVMDYKLNHLWDCDSALYKKYSKEKTDQTIAK